MGNEDINSIYCRVIVKFKNDLNLPYYEAEETGDFFRQNHIIPWQYLQEQFPGIRIDKLFTSLEPEKINGLVNKAREKDPGYSPPDFLRYYFIDCKQNINRNALLQTLLTYKSIELAYLENRPAGPPSFVTTGEPLDRRQSYLNAAPEGIDARYAWQIAGGDGGGNIKFIDIEQGWLLNHKALSIKTLPCTGINHYMFEDHGAGVLGIIMMQDTERGGKGITPKAEGHIVSQWRPDGSFNTADAIMAAINHLDAGDILLLESQVYDSPFSYNALPVEIEDAIFHAMSLAAALGIVVIEPAGNGNIETRAGNDLDIFGINGEKILNPADPDFRDSGAIMVAAASSATPHTRIRYSNYGKRVNCYAWGQHVVTAGHYPDSSGFAINTFTGKFDGTSSASAIIAGAAIAIQSIREANGNPPLTPKEMRHLLSTRSMGTASANGHAIDKIGVMPDLRKIITHALMIRPETIDFRANG